MADGATFNTQSGTGFVAIVVAAKAGGNPVRVYDIHVISTTTRTNLELRTDSVTGPIYCNVQVTDVSATEVSNDGTRFPNGLYLVTGANFSIATINYITEL